MKYVLAIGLLVKPYRSPKMRLFLNDKFIDEVTLDEIKEKKISYKVYGQFIESAIAHTSIPEKFYIYHIDENILKKENYLKVQFLDCSSNHTNGFITKSDQYLVHSLFFAPENLYFKSKENFEEQFNNKILKENNFICDNDDDAFYNRVTKKVNMPGWPCPSVCEDTKLSFNDQTQYYEGKDKIMTYKIIKKYGIYTFDIDLENIEPSPGPEEAGQTSVKWNEFVSKLDSKKAWPVLNSFFAFCYHNKNNKYLHEDQRSNH